MTEIIIDYHSKYLASDLVRRRSSDSSEKLAVAVAGAQVDMNPHQVDAALFAFASPLSKGALLADEVGLGKTIEAGLVISQRWAEGIRDQQAVSRPPIAAKTASVAETNVAFGAMLLRSPMSAMAQWGHRPAVNERPLTGFSAQ